MTPLLIGLAIFVMVAAGFVLLGWAVVIVTGDENYPVGRPPTDRPLDDR